MRLKNNRFLRKYNLLKATLTQQIITCCKSAIKTLDKDVNIIKVKTKVTRMVSMTLLQCLHFKV